METFGSLKEILDTIGVFIGTYGLAVFLVVYYAVKLYPELKEERGEWIREITKLKELVDPATRPLTKEQAKTVLLIVSDSFINRFALFGEEGFMRLKASSSRPVDYGSKETAERVYILNDEFEYYPDREMSSEDRINELKHIFLSFEGLWSQCRRQKKTN